MSKILKSVLLVPLAYIAVMFLGIIVIGAGGVAYLVVCIWGRHRRRRARADLKEALERACALKADELAKRRVGVIRKGPWKDPRDRQRSFNEHLRDQARGRYS